MVKQIALNNVPHPRGEDPRGPSRQGEVKKMLAALMIGAALLAGCAAGPSAPPRLVEVKAPIPTPVYCAVPALVKPALPIAGLTPVSAPADTIRAYAATVVILKGAVEDRDQVIAGCAAPVAKAGP
ncbi:MAG: hypothetical protein ACREP6_06530 [Candidatus Binataceae bacterium]